MEKLNISVVLPVESSKHKNFNDLFKSCMFHRKSKIKESERGDVWRY